MVHVFGVGNVVADAVERVEGKLTTLTVAFNENYQKDGKWETSTTYLDVKAWAGVSTSALRLKKGDTVELVGRLSQDEWKDKDDQKRTKIVCVANSIRRLRKKDGTEEGTTGEETTPTTVTGEVPF